MLFKKIVLVLILVFLICTNVYADGLVLQPHITLNGVTVNESGMRIIENGEMICSVDVINTSQTGGSIAVILATYTLDGNLHKVRTYKNDIAAGGSTNVEFSYEFDSETEHSGKLMFWNSLDNFIPLRASVDFTQNSGINAYYYNVDNKLLQIDKANGKSLIFTYDNMGNLLLKTVREVEDSE